MQIKDIVQNYSQEKLISLPSEAVARFGRGSVSDTAISPDGNLIAVASRISVWLYDVHTDDFLRLIAVEGTGLLSVVTFSHDGTKLATGDWDGIATGAHVIGYNDGCTTLWNVESGEAIWDFTHEESVTSITFTSDNRYMETRFWSGGTDVRCVADGTSTSFHKGELAKSTREPPSTHPRDLYGWLVNFSPDGRHLVSMASSSLIKTWSVESGENIKTIDRDEDAGTSRIPNVYNRRQLYWFKPC